MFEIGLPVRGTIHIGEAVVSKRCFVGKDIVKAYKLSKKCQVAATIVSEKAAKFLLNAFLDTKVFHSMYKDLIIEADIPMGVTKPRKSALSRNRSQKMKTLCWLFLELGKTNRFAIPSDFDTYVRNKFVTHGKKLLGNKETMKAFNTANLFRHWQTTSNGQYRQRIQMTADRDHTVKPGK